MSDEYPTPSRTVSVDTAALLRDQLEHSGEQVEAADNEIGEAYHTARADATQEYLEAIEGDGLDEEVVREDYDEYEEAFDADADENPEDARYLARMEAAEQVLKQYFGDGESAVVDLGDLASSSELEDGKIALDGRKGKAELSVSSEGMARATADLFLAQSGSSLDELAATPGGRL